MDKTEENGQKLVCTGVAWVDKGVYQYNISYRQSSDDFLLTLKDISGGEYTKNYSKRGEVTLEEITRVIRTYKGSPRAVQQGQGD